MANSNGRHMVTFYRSLSAMLDAGLPIYAIFDFFGEEGEHPELSKACARIATRLSNGSTLHHAAAAESQFFDAKAVRMIEAGHRSGSLPNIIRRLAEDEEKTWKLWNQLRSQLVYPMTVAAIATVAVILLPPLVLTDLLETVIQMTDEPPALTKALLTFSGFVGSPVFLLALGVLAVVAPIVMRRPEVKGWMDRREPLLWEVPAVGDLWRDVVVLRFLSVFGMAYESGLPATQCLLISSSATGSLKAQEAGPRMKTSLVEGGTLKESLAVGGIIPPMTLEAVEAGEQSGSIPVMIKSASELLEAEVECRIDAVSKFVEPVVLFVLGLFVGLFAVGCLLPIIKLSESI